MLHKITFLLLLVLTTITSGYSSASWCEHNEENVSGHLLLETLADSSFTEHTDHNSETKEECPGCVHVPAIDVAGQADFTHLLDLPAPALDFLVSGESSICTSASLMDSDIFSYNAIWRALPPRPQLEIIRTFILII